MKMQFTISDKELSAWKKRPHGYFVLTVPGHLRFESAEVGTRIDIVRTPPDPDRAIRKLEHIREEFDTNPKGMRPKLVVVSLETIKDPRAVQFLRRRGGFLGI